MYTIRQAAARSGVPSALQRAWERRYGIVQPQRTAAGYRLYDDAAIELLRAMRLLVDAGWSAREAAARVAAADPTELTGIQRELDARPVPDGPFATLVTQFVDAAAGMDGGAMDAALDRAFATARFESVADEMVLPALQQVGRRWASGEMSVAAEHAASAAIMRRLGMAFEAAGDRPDGATVLVGLPAGSRHEVAAMAFAVAARRAGIDAVYLGADVPADSWLDAARRRGARAAVLGAVTADDVEPATTTLQLLRRRAPEVIRAIGGRHAADVAVPGTLQLPDGIGHAVTALTAELARG
jgi:DNA-binding transcriptional MerR regulator/methylmalonyl-CoA mutase cobalamin-binding subunit